MRLRVFQIFYGQEQILHLDKGFVPYYNACNTNLFENQVIKSIYLNRQYTGADYVGATSWRVKEKTGLTSEKIKGFMEANKADIYLYGNMRGYPFISDALRRNRHNYTGEIIARAYANNVFKRKNPQLNWVPVFCNYWICRPGIFEKYCHEYLLPMEQFIAEDYRSGSLLAQGYQAHRDTQYPRHPFVYEFLFGLFTYNHLNEFTVAEIPFDLDKPDMRDMVPLPAKRMHTPQLVPANEPTALHPKWTNTGPNIPTMPVGTLPLADTKRIVGFYHVFAINNWIEVVLEQIEMMLSSGLYDAAEAIYIGFNGSQHDLETFKRVTGNLPKISVARVSDNALDYEFTTLRVMLQQAERDDFYGFYLHSKGVTSAFVQSHVSINRWRDCLNHYTISRWAWNVEKLNGGYNSSGVQYKDFVPNFPPHYSGNFFWFDSPLIKTLAPLTPEFCTDRFNAERWLSTSNTWRPANFKTFHNFTDTTSFLPITKPDHDLDYNHYKMKSGLVFENPDYLGIMHATGREIQNLKVKTAVDIVSGTGVLVNLLNKQYGVDTIGVDPSLQNYAHATDPVRCDPAIISKYKTGGLDDIAGYADVFIALGVLERMEHAKVKAFLSKVSRRCMYFYFSGSPFANDEAFDITWGRINVKPKALWIKLFDECGFEVYKFTEAPNPWSIIFRSKPFKPVI